MIYMIGTFICKTVHKTHKGRFEVLYVPIWKTYCIWDTIKKQDIGSGFNKKEVAIDVAEKLEALGNI